MKELLKNSPENIKKLKQIFLNVSSGIGVGHSYVVEYEGGGGITEFTTLYTLVNLNQYEQLQNLFETMLIDGLAVYKRKYDCLEVIWRNELRS